MKKWFCAVLHRFGRRYIYPTESLFGTWGLYCEYGVNANGPFHRDCSLYDSWITLQPANRGYRDERGEIEPLRWHRIGCRRITVDDSGWQPFRKIVRLTRDELWLKTELGHKDEYRRIECYRRGTPPPDPETIYEQYCRKRASEADSAHIAPNKISINAYPNGAKNG